MKRKLLRGVLFLFFLMAPVVAYSQTEIKKEKLVSRGANRTYYVFVPEAAKGSAPLPLIITFHGSGRNGLTLVEKWKEVAAREGIILAGPDSTNPQVWQIDDDGPEFLRSLIEALKSKYPIDTRRVYLFGHSGGAVFALNLSMVESEYFAATAVHAGSWRTDAEFRVIENARRKIPLAIFVGDVDPFFSVQSVKATSDALKARGFPIEVTIIRGHDHWYYDRAPEINRNVWDFLKGHKLLAEPRYAELASAKAAGDANRLIAEMNVLRSKANELLNQFNAREAEIPAAYRGVETEANRKIPQDQIRLSSEGAAALRESAGKAEQAGTLNLSEKYKQFLALIAQIDRMRAEAFEALRAQAEALLSNEPADVVNRKRTEAAGRAQKLLKEAAELELKAHEILAKD